MTIQYKPKGVCSQLITIEVEGDLIQSVQYVGGCNGNLKGIGNLLKGMTIDDAIEKMDGISCGPRPTSCPDQTAKALKELKAHKAKQA